MAPTNPDRSEPALERDRALAARAARTAEPPVNRRQPQQARSQAKVDAILDATDALVAEVGVDEITTTLVAARAGVAVGSLYRYFEGVPKLIEGLAARHIDRFGVRLREAFAGQRIVRKHDAANLALDTMVEHCRATPEFPALWRGAPAVVGLCFEQNAEVLLGPIVAGIVGEGLAVPTDDDFVKDVQIQWATGSALILLAFRLDPQGDPVVLAHLRYLFTLDIDMTGATASDDEVDIRDLADVTAPD